MRLAQLAGAAIVLLTAAPDACRNKCDFFERCSGNVRETCGGIDQCIGRRVERQPCVAPNEACVTDGFSALCVRAPPGRCEGDFVEHCEGSVSLSCSVSPSGYIVAQDCATIRRIDGTNAGLICALDNSGRSQCVPAP
jgi:hypothetical protein